MPFDFSPKPQNWAAKHNSRKAPMISRTFPLRIRSHANERSGFRLHTRTHVCKETYLLDQFRPSAQRPIRCNTHTLHCWTPVEADCIRCVCTQTETGWYNYNYAIKTNLLGRKVNFLNRWRKNSRLLGHFRGLWRSCPEGNPPIEHRSKKWKLLFCIN